MEPTHGEQETIRELREGEVTVPQVTAADVMSENPRTVRVDEAIDEAISALEQLDVRHLPVVNDEGELVGMLSDRDLRALVDELDADTLERRARIPVSDVMSGAVVSIEPDAVLVEIAELLLDHRIGAVPVVDPEHHVIGVVSYVDLLRALVSAE